MVEYDIKKGWYKNIEKDLLEKMMKDIFGNVAKKGGGLESSYGVLETINVKLVGKDKMVVTTTNKTGPMTDADILDSKRTLNKFVEKATGFDSKARMKRAQAKAKEGKL